MQTGWWSLQGLTEGSATLTETVSGRSWSLPRLPTSSAGDASVVEPGGTVDYGPDRTWQSLEIEFPRTGDEWHFELETSEAGVLVCDFVFDQTGRFSDLWSDDADVSVTVVCGAPLDELEFADPGLEACLAGLPDPPPHSGFLRSLDCSDRGIEDLDGLSWLWALGELDLSHNLLELDDDEVNELTRLSSLWSLDLSHNLIERVVAAGVPPHVPTPDPVFVLPAGRLDLSHNRITSFSVFGSVGVISLSLAHNQLEEFLVARPWTDYPAEGPEPVLVAIFPFGGFGGAIFDITSPDDDDELPDTRPIGFYAAAGTLVAGVPEPNGFFVEELDVSFNRLTHLDLSDTGDWLRSVDASRNDLETLILPQAEGELRRVPIHRLDVSFNRLADPSLASEPPTGLVLGGEGVQLLDVSYNALTSLDARLVSPISQEVVARGNQIDAIDLGDASELLVLDLAQNELASIDLAGASSLTDLDVSDNALLGFEWTDEAAWLDTLDLSGNPLDALDDCTAANLWSLRIEDAGLASLDLSGCPSLEWVELAGNDLVSIDVAPLDALERLDLRDNPLSCAAIDAIEAAQPAAELLSGPDACVP